MGLPALWRRRVQVDWDRMLSAGEQFERMDV